MILALLGKGMSLEHLRLRILSDKLLCKLSYRSEIVGVNPEIAFRFHARREASPVAGIDQNPDEEHVWSQALVKLIEEAFRPDLHCYAEVWLVPLHGVLDRSTHRFLIQSPKGPF